MKRFAVLLLAVFFCMTVCFTACGKKDNNNGQTASNETPKPVETVSPSSQPEETPTPEPAPSVTPVPGNTDQPVIEKPIDPSRGIENETLKKIADDVFYSAVLDNAFSYHQFVKSVDSFEIDPEEIPTGWGEYSIQSHLDGISENKELGERLHSIDRDSLSDYEKIVYDNFEEALRLTDDLNDYYYFDEPLTPFNGEHTMLPLIITMYEIENLDDAMNYLTLLEDMPRYIGQIEQFEIEKSQFNLFMTENALDQVVEACRKYADEGDDFFLIDSFEAAVNSCSAIPESEKAALFERNTNCIMNSILPAYTHLANTLESLRPTCRAFASAAARSADEVRYYELKIRSEAAVDLSCDEMADMLDDLSTELYAELMVIAYTDTSAIQQYGSPKTSGDHDRDVQYLLELIDGIYPMIPEQNIDFVNIPDALADDFSPAAYLISAFDDPSRNVVMFNPSANDNTMLFTLAHECFPGHLYQTQYFRANRNLCLAQQAITPSGYSEGWAVFSELMIAKHADKYNINTCLIEKDENIVTNILIPGYVSIKVNHDGWTKDDISSYLAGYMISNEDYVDLLYEYSVDVPLYFFNYAMGFANLMRIYNNVAHDTDQQLSQFLERYLSYGPCFFDILNEKFGVK